jgi:hypothetical protein
MIPKEYLPDFMKDAAAPAQAPKKAAEPTRKEKVSSELKQAVKEVVTKQAAQESKEPPSTEPPAEPKKVEHPPDGHRVTNEEISSVLSQVNQTKAAEDAETARQSAAQATQYNEGETVTITKQVDTTLPSSKSAVLELQSKSQSETSAALSAATSTLRNDLDQTFLADLDTLSPTQLRTRLIQLVAEMSDRTKWEAIRIQEFTSLKEKELGEKYLEIVQKQRLEYEDLLAKRIREAEDAITRQANEALRAKEEGVQNLLMGMREGREKEVADSVRLEVGKIRGDLELEYQSRLQNELAEAKAMHVAELEKYMSSINSMASQLSELETRLQISKAYESGSKKAHAVSAAALALANKLEAGESVEVEVAALRGATAGEEGVIAGAVKMIPGSVERGMGVPTVGELQVAFDRSYKKGREVSCVFRLLSGLRVLVLCVMLPF